MTFPIVSNSSSGSSATTSTTAHVVTLPTGIVAGNLLLISTTNDANTASSLTTPSGWNSLYNANTASANMAVLWRLATGSEGATLALTWSTAGRGTWVAYQVSGWNKASTPAIASTTYVSINNPQSPALTPSWGALDTLWITTLGFTRSGVTVSTYPASYSDNQLYVQNSSIGLAHSVFATRNNATATETPGAFLLSNTTTGAAATIGIRPGVVGAAGTASGAATVSGVGKATTQGLGTAAGVATVAGTAAATAKAAGTASGAAAVAAGGASLSPAVGTATGTASVAGVALPPAVGAGTAIGAGTASGTGASVAFAVGVATGAATVSAIGGGRQDIFPTGVYTTGMVGNGLVWQLVPDGPSGNWTPVAT